MQQEVPGTVLELFFGNNCNVSNGLNETEPNQCQMESKCEMQADQGQCVGLNLTIKQDTLRTISFH